MNKKIILDVDGVLLDYNKKFNEIYLKLSHYKVQQTRAISIWIDEQQSERVWAGNTLG